MSEAFILCLVAIFGLAALGAPIAHSIIVGAITFLAVNGQDLALAAEQIIQGLYESFVLLAVPLFIVAANIMNAGTVSDRLLQFCVALVGANLVRRWKYCSSALIILNRFSSVSSMLRLNLVTPTGIIDI